MSSNPTGQGYSDPNSASLLDQVRRYIAQTKSGKTSSNAYTPSYGVTAKDSASVADAVATSSTAIGIFDVIDDSANQKLWLSFDSDVVDKSGNANDGTVTGTTTYTTDINRYFDGRYSKAFSFDGSSYITIPNESQFDLTQTSTMSVSFWLSIPSGLSTTKTIFAKTNDWVGVTDIGWGVGYTSAFNRVFIRFWDGTNNMGRRSSDGASFDGWHHYVLTKSSGTSQTAVKVYRDGVDVTTADINGTLSATLANTRTPTVGAESDASRIMDVGVLMNDLQFWNIELSQAEVTRLAQARQISHNAAVLQPSYAGFFDVAV